jgi:alpha-glucuronidase
MNVRHSLVCLAVALLAGAGVRAETGYNLWLRYTPIENAEQATAYTTHARTIVVESQTQTGGIIRAELSRGLSGMLGREVPPASNVAADGAVVVGTPRYSPLVAALLWDAQLTELGSEGYVIRSAVVSGRQATVIASAGETGALYGAFHFLRLIQTGQPLIGIDIAQRPRVKRRMLDHWDNLDRSIERGYAGRSLWNWDELPERVDPRMLDYARANASIGINGTVLDNVNASPQVLTSRRLAKVKALADAFRPYGIRVYLAVNFASPKVLGGLETADPLDPAVAPWWRDKVAEIYNLIPDFGGFLVKANSEGQPGPLDYGRSHADGANMLADAVKPHGGVLLWRAFVYDDAVDPDRVKRAYLDFVPLDGTFRDNVFVQVKNGPLDFQPREPFHPLFGAMPKTPLAAELQITQEYLGHSNHLVYLGTLWEEFLQSDTYANGPGSTVARVADGTLHGYRDTAIAGVANTGDDRNWTGHDFGQANWYAFGRLAWDPDLRAAEIADEWIPMTWGHDPAVVSTIRSMLLDSREALVDYSMPLGLHHLIGGDHYAPMPENAQAPRADWTATYYHQAEARGIGFDRTASGSNAAAQYHAPLSEWWNDPATCPPELLLWFHHLPWDYRLPSSGRTLWEELISHYTRGVEKARQLEARWQLLHGRLDAGRYEAVAAKLRIQVADADAWSEKCRRYFQSFSRRPLPPSF